MTGYDVILVDGRLAICWHDETIESAVARKRAEEVVVTADVLRPRSEDHDA